MIRLTLLLIALLLVLTTCGGNQDATPAPVAAAPTDTPLPTATPIPTNTPEPTATPTPAPTDTPTPEPTATPAATETPLPTDTPTPTATPEPVAVVTGDRLNVRSGPGTVYPVVAQAPKDDTFPLLARNEDATWLEVTLPDGRRGWVAASLVASSVPAESLSVAADVPPTPLPLPTSAPVPTAPTAPTTPSSGPTGAIVGRVLGGDGEPIPGEAVTLLIITLQNTQSTVVYTGSDGKFVFADLPSGPGYQFTLFAGPQGRGQIVKVNGKIVFTLQPGETLDVANVNLP